jgi:TetR/AcrR family transcriptional regulator, transcriptional repressor for nem operon
VPRDGQATRQRLLDEAEYLVIEQGFAATSVDQVIAAANSSKGAFFNHFPTKQALAAALIQRYAEADVAHLFAGLAAAQAASDDPAEQLIHFLRDFEEQGDALLEAQSNCLYVSMLAERQLVADGTVAPIVSAIETWREQLAAKVRAAQVDRPGAAVVDAGDLADHIFATFEGAFVLCRSTGDPSHMRRQLRVIRLLVEALFGTPATTRPLVLT